MLIFLKFHNLVQKETMKVSLAVNPKTLKQQWASSSKFYSNVSNKNRKGTWLKIRDWSSSWRKRKQKPWMRWSVIMLSSWTMFPHTHMSDNETKGSWTTFSNRTLTMKELLETWVSTSGILKHTEERRWWMFCVRLAALILWIQLCFIKNRN